ncbi:hypothetical protein N665_0458s0031 [Sinapis alba]|nr:hypothetical protein N665_0458s0031 [Sinapis alba]
MSSSSNTMSSSRSGNWRRRGGQKERGMPKSCRCGEASTIKTSGTAKNPGRLFHCCPNGSEGDKFHLFKWTDECMVEEIDDLKTMLSDEKEDMLELRATVSGFEKELEDMKKMIMELENERKDCISEVKFLKNVMVCYGLGSLGMMIFGYYIFV